MKSLTQIELAWHLWKSEIPPDGISSKIGKHRVSKAYKKNEQSFIESFNTTLRKECLGWRKYCMNELPRVKEQVKEYEGTSISKILSHLILNLPTYLQFLIFDVFL